MAKSGVVHIVHHIDTEGPLHEPLSGTFSRIEQLFGITIDAPRTRESLQQMRSGKLLGEDTSVIEGVKKLLDPRLMSLYSTWEEIDAMLRVITSSRFRGELPDSFGGGWIFNWHVLCQAGFETNETGKDLGYLKIFNHYEALLKETGSLQDRIHWHFHPISFFREAHISATSYENSYPELHQVLCRRLIDKKWFPVVNRAGFHTERPDSNWFLEQWMPFDASNQALSGAREVQGDAVHGRFGDWSGAPDDGSIYHPALYDWRKKGALNRSVARALNLNARMRNITEDELEKAFKAAADGAHVYVGITNHDFRDMAREIRDFREMLRAVSGKFPSVQYKFSEAVEAFRAVLGYAGEEKLEFGCTIAGNVLTVTREKGEFFGPQPYLAIKTKDGRYFHDNFDFGEFKQTYFYTFDRYTIPLEKVETVAVASNDKYGNTAIKFISSS